ncbi:MAG: hypothetical protein GX273_09800 [Bacteroidales bacterium]|nr:hypothetical protein [Bacteroidales bacterium]
MNNEQNTILTMAINTQMSFINNTQFLTINGWQNNEACINDETRDLYLKKFLTFLTDAINTK